MKKRKKKSIPVAFGVLAAFLFFGLLFLAPQVVRADGLVDGIGGGDTGYLYTAYALENYDIDFYVDTSWSWLPWNWLDAVGRQIMHGLYVVTNGLWYLSRLISAATGAVVSEAYRFDLINEVADNIGENMQRIAGVSASGLSGDGFYPGFIMLILVVLGVYTAYVGLYKREVSRAVGAAVKAAVIFIMTTGLIVYAPQGIRMINEFSSDISAAALRLGTGVSMPGSSNGEGGSVELIRDNLFSIQVYQPWLLMQWGTTDVNEIGQDRVSGLLAASPDEEYGQTREELVKTEIETYGNMRMTLPKVVTRFGEVLFIFFINLAISFFVFLMCGALVLTQIMFIIYTLFLVVNFVISMFPECEGVLRTSLVKVFNVMMLRVGYTLMITFAFTISTMIYSVAGNHAFVTIGFLQIVTFAGIFFSKGDILKMISLQDDGGARRMQAAGGLLAYSQMRRGSLARRAAGNVAEKAKGLGRANLEIAEGTARVARGKAVAYADRRAAQWHRERAAQSAAETARMRREHDYTVAREIPETGGASIYRRDDGSGVTSQNVYDRYFHGEKPHRYHAARSTPDKVGAEFTTSGQRTAQEKYIRPEKWAHAPTGEDVKGAYYKRRFEDKTADRITPDSIGAELKDEPRRYHVAERGATPKAVNKEIGKKISAKKRDMRTDARKQQETPAQKSGEHTAVRVQKAGEKEIPRRYHAAGRKETPELVKEDLKAKDRERQTGTGKRQEVTAEKKQGNVPARSAETKKKEAPYRGHTADRREMPDAKKVQEVKRGEVQPETRKRQETKTEAMKEDPAERRMTVRQTRREPENLHERREERSSEKEALPTKEETGGNGEKD